MSDEGAGNAAAASGLGDDGHRYSIGIHTCSDVIEPAVAAEKPGVAGLTVSLARNARNEVRWAATPLLSVRFREESAPAGPLGGWRTR